MNRVPFFISLLSISLSFNLLPAQAQSCQDLGNNGSTAYTLRRDNNQRCEGIRNPTVSSGLDLISFTIGTLSQPAKDNRFTLQVPDRVNGRFPTIIVRYPQKNYQLDPVYFVLKGKFFEFKWSKAVLENARIPLNGLRATAYSLSGTQRIYSPVIFGNSNQYRIVFAYKRAFKITKFQIRLKNSKSVCKGTLVYTRLPTELQLNKQISFAWNGKDKNGKNANAGRYELCTEAELEQDNRAFQKFPLYITFAHDPQWLK